MVCMFLVRDIQKIRLVIVLAAPVNMVNPEGPDLPGGKSAYKRHKKGKTYRRQSVWFFPKWWFQRCFWHSIDNLLHPIVWPTESCRNVRKKNRTKRRHLSSNDTPLEENLQKSNKNTHDLILQFMTSFDKTPKWILEEQQLSTEL